MPAPQVWPVPANSRETLVELYGYQTQVMRAISGMEQRVKLRRHPIGGLQASYFCADVVDAHHALAVLYGNLAKPLLVPLWFYARPITVAVNPGDTTIYTDTSDVPVRDPLGFNQYGVLWSGVRSYEAVAVSGGTGSTIVIDAPGAVKSWPASGAYFITARIGRIVGGAALSFIARQLVDGPLEFNFEPGAKPATDIGFEGEFTGFDGQVLPVEG